jgi:hypothetical protein
MMEPSTLPVTGTALADAWNTITAGTAIGTATGIEAVTGTN